MDPLLFGNAEKDDANLVECSFNMKSRKFLLTSRNGYFKQSKVTEIEQVSYVVSPFIPEIYRAPHAPPLYDNLWRCDAIIKSNKTGSDIRDKLDEVITLNNTSICLLEWIPFGSNQLGQLSDRLGILDRCSGGMFSAKVDGDSNESLLKIKPTTTKIAVSDFIFSRFVNFRAEWYSNDESTEIYQVESFGVNIDVSGQILTGVTLNSIMTTKTNNLSIDKICRVLIDMQTDSTL
jgi:hypothetical protein